MKALSAVFAAILLFLLPAGAAQTGPVREEWKEIWRNFGLDAAVAESVVWPEILRYNSLSDVAETAADYGAHIIGSDTPDYSIGIFQMRPSFVKDLEMAWMRSGLADEYNLPFDISETVSARYKRIGRISSNEWQAVYLAVFIRLLYHSYNLDTLPIEDQVRLAATAYNRGCAWTDAGRGNVAALRKYSGARYATRAWEHYQSIAD